MTETEQKAAEAWPLVFHHSMPPRVAVDFVQDVCGQRPVALESLIAQAVLMLANTRPTIAQATGGTFADGAAGVISGLLSKRDFDTAGPVLYDMRTRMAREAPSLLDQGWREWNAAAERTLKLCRELTTAAVGKVFRGDRGRLGLRNPEGMPNVTVDGKALNPKPSQKLWNHSPDGFNWGYGGSGPAQLALAILLDVTADPDLAQILHQRFKRRFVIRWGDRWELTEAEVREWLADPQERP